ncbi:hypothetical protein HHK36_029268 [Tetracentron sinense]|uniref:Uncharacterized protein n=1 Tax=Tetracentron sinense TaxID=13715 RepID=A0A834YEL9_TETSI|nr:hypothetical protein HHK36_029268 [Tetracentron sinense]
MEGEWAADVAEIPNEEIKEKPLISQRVFGIPTLRNYNLEDKVELKDIGVIQLCIAYEKHVLTVLSMVETIIVVYRRMGEVVVVSSEEGVEETVKKDSCASVVRWERFLPRMVLRVLLVEADDSTRQIISALLRKCNYRVAAVPDGLKAWETLKRRPHSFDLILTEMELPSISGFALLTLMMEHEICKSIPVIMMSSHDSISMVFKCMSRGAADFLIKPVRRNELRNLWQHVWRRQSSTCGYHGPQDGSPAQQKVEATSENNAASNNSSDYVTSTQKNNECSEKGSDAQSSSTKPDLEAESAYMQNMQDLLQPECWSKSLVSDKKIQKHKECVTLDHKLLVHESEAGDISVRLRSEVALCNKANNSTELILEDGHNCAKQMTRGEDVSPKSLREDANISSETHDNNNEAGEPSAEAIDLIGTFDIPPKRTYGHSSSNDGTNKFGSSLPLELSLRRSHPSSGEIQGTDERHTLNHSIASAFSRYNCRKLPPLCPASTSTGTKEHESNTRKPLFNQVHGSIADAPQCHGAPLNTRKNMTPPVTGQSGLAETVFPCPRVEVISVPVPVRGIRFDSPCAGFGAVLPPIFYTQSGPPPVWNSNSDSQQEPSFRIHSSHQSNPETNNSELVHHALDQNANNSTNHSRPEQEHNLEYLEDRRHVSPATVQSASSSFCNGAISHLNSSGCGSICNGSNVNVTPATLSGTAEECGNNEGILIHDGSRMMNSHRSTQREAALTKFRLKRKDRCYDKKVRYQSRKTLAEQRPRIKGQFVRQVQTDSHPAEMDCY